MERRTLIGLAAVGAVVAIVSFRLCGAGPEKTGSAPKARVDVVRGVTPVSTAFAGIAPMVDEMAAMSPQERGRFIEQNYPHLQTDIAYFLRRMGKLTPGRAVTRVTFHYGSLNDVSAENGDGAQVRGYFRNQLIALAYHSGSTQPVAVIVECLNGTFVLPEQVGRDLQLVGEHTPRERFRIGKGEGLIHHVDYPTAIAIAEQFRLPLYRGKTMRERAKITPDEARALESSTDRLQVTVHVVEGDEFDLVGMKFEPSYLRRTRQ